jgi:hypothetical protein
VVTSRTYVEALSAARAELERLLEEQDMIQIRIARVRNSIAALSSLCDEAPSTDLGLTDAVRSVLRGSVEALAAPEVKERLDALGLDLSGHVNALASVHTVLKRLVQAGEARSTEGHGGKTVYWYWHPSQVIAISTVPPLPAARHRKKK